ncbi:MAG: hypothetical protein ACE5G2_01370 [Candidatus Krumholzibacteriia bacterium]
MQRALVLLVVVAVQLQPSDSRAQLVPGKHSVMPQFGATFATTDLLAATTLVPFGPPPHDEINPVSTEMTLDPGVFAGARYAYNLTRRLALEAEFGLGVSVFAIQMLELQEEMEGEPQFETTTTDARVFQYFVNLSYFFGPWEAVHPFVTLGVGSHSLDLRQKGPVNPDPVIDRAFMAGLGLLFHANDRLGIRVELRDFMYNFHFDNQFVSDLAGQIVSNRDIGLVTEVAGPRFQNDLVLSLGFMVRTF